MRTIILLMHPLTGEWCWYISDETGKTISIWNIEDFGSAVEILITKEEA